MKFFGLWILLLFVSNVENFHEPKIDDDSELPSMDKIPPVDLDEDDPTTTTTTTTTEGPTVITTTTMSPNQELNQTIHEISNLLHNITIGTSSMNNTFESKEEWFGILETAENLITNIVDEPPLYNTLDLPGAIEVSDLSFRIVNQLIEKPKIWSRLNQSERVQSSSGIFQLAKRLSRMMNVKQEAAPKPRRYRADYSSVDVQSNAFRVDINDYIVFEFDQTTIELPFEALINSSIDPFGAAWKPFCLTIVVMNNLTSYLSYGNLVVNSEIISVTIENYSGGPIHLNYPHYFRYRTKNFEPLQFGDKVHCVFWDTVISNWSSTGCWERKIDSNKTYTVCECDHLTNFAVLMDISHREGPTPVKSIMTFVFSGLNVVFITASIGVAIKFNSVNYLVAEDTKKLKSNKHSLTLNISFCLLVSHILIMFGLDRTENALTCNIISIVLLLFLLSTFCFMLMLSFHLLLSSNTTFFQRAIDFKYYAVAGYLLPVIIVAVSLWLIYLKETEDVLHALAGEHFCWISSSLYPQNIWIFVGPATVIICLNMIILLYLIIVSKRIIKKAARIEKSKSIQEKSNALLSSSFYLTFNFGLPWILYLFYINEYFRYFSYAFIVINGTQGLAFFAEQVYLYRSRQQQMQIYRQRRDSFD